MISYEINILAYVSQEIRSYLTEKITSEHICIKYVEDLKEFNDNTKDADVALVSYDLIKESKLKKTNVILLDGPEELEDKFFCMPSKDFMHISENVLENLLGVFSFLKRVRDENKILREFIKTIVIRETTKDVSTKEVSKFLEELTEIKSSFQCMR